MNNNISSYVVGVDVGGTFTDIFFLNETTGDCKVAKVQTTLNNQAEGFLAGILKNVDQVADITTVVHGTTVGTNALLERKGAKTGIITSVGFRDVLGNWKRWGHTDWGCLSFRRAWCICGLRQWVRVVRDRRQT